MLSKLASLLNRDNLRGKIIHSGLWVSISAVSLRFLAVIRTIILARLLSPTIFGLMGIVNFILDGLETFTQTGFNSALIYQQENIKETADVAWTLNIIRGIILTIAVYTLAPLVANFYNQPLLTSLIRVISISFIIKGFRNVNMVLFHKELDFKKVVALEQIASLTGFVVTIALAYYLRNIWALIWGNLAFFILDNFLSYIIQSRRPSLKFNIKLAKNIFNYGIFITGANVVSFLATESDDALVGKILGMEELGYYVLAYSLARIPLEINKMASKVMFPVYSQAQNHPDKLKALFLKTLKFIAGFSIPAAAGLYILAPAIINILYGNRWAPAVPIVRILSIYGALWAVQATTLSFFRGLGKPRYGFYAEMGRFSTLLLLMYFFTSRYGLLGAAISVVFSIIPTFFLSLFYMKSLGIEPADFLQALIKPCLSSIFMVTAIYLLSKKINPINTLNLIFLILTGIVLIFIINQLYALKKIIN